MGIGTVRNVAKRLGIKSQMSALPSLALGTLEVSLQEMVTAYAHLANGGKAVAPYGIVEIRRKSDNKVLYTRTDNEDYSDVMVIAPDNVAKMNAMLGGVLEYGTGKAANIGRPGRRENRYYLGLQGRMVYRLYSESGGGCLGGER